MKDFNNEKANRQNNLILTNNKKIDIHNVNLKSMLLRKLKIREKKTESTYLSIKRL